MSSRNRGRSLLVAALALLLTIGACVADTGMKAGSYVANLSLARSANVSITIPEARGFIDALTTNGINVLEARVEYLGEIKFDVRGSEVREVILAEDRMGRAVQGDKPIWEMRLTNRVPLALTLNTEGELNANLARLNVSTLTLNQSDGKSNVILPQGTFEVTTVLSSGEMNMVAGRGRVFNADVTVNGGTLIVNVPANAAVQVNLLDGDVSSLTLPETFTQTETTWQSEAFTGEDVQGMVINLTVGGGTVVINAVG